MSLQYLEHPLRDAAPTRAAHGQSAGGALEQVLDCGKLRTLQATGSVEVIAELNHVRIDHVVAGFRRRLPVVGQVASDQHQIHRHEGRDVIPHDTMALAGQCERQFVLGVKVPRAAEAVSSHPLHKAGLSRRIWNPFE